MTMKRITALVLAMVMLFALFSGCKKTDEKPVDPVKPVESDKDAKVEVPKNARTDIVIGKAADVVNPDPHEQNDTSSNAAIRMMYNALLWRNHEGELVPALAEKWEIVDDVTYKFTIRKGVKFHNGAELTLEDIKFSIDRAREAARVKFLVEAIKEVTIDEKDHSVTVVTQYPYAPMLGNLAATQISIICKSYLEELEASGKKYADAPVGTGPMKFDSWTPNDNFKVVRFDDYWGEKAIATSVKFRVIPEESSRTIALQMNEVDMLETVPAIDIKRVLDDPKFTTIRQPSPSMTYASYNMTKAPYDNLKVRQAMNYAVNKKEMVDVICEGYANEVNTIYSSLVFGYDETLNLYPYNPEKAKQLMIEAGYPDGFKANIALNSDERNRVAQLLQAHFAPIGIELDITLMEWGAYLEHISKKEHEMYVLGWSASNDPDGTVNPLFHTDSGGPTGNRSWFSNKTVDELIGKGRRLIEWKDREPVYKEIQKVCMEDAVWIPLFSKETVIAMNKNLKGVGIDPADSHVYVYAYVEK